MLFFQPRADSRYLFLRAAFSSFTRYATLIFAITLISLIFAALREAVAQRARSAGSLVADAMPQPLSYYAMFRYAAAIAFDYAAIPITLCYAITLLSPMLMPHYDTVDATRVATRCPCRFAACFSCRCHARFSFSFVWRWPSLLFLF